MSNLSLMNPGTSLNFDGAALQNQEEAEYRKEEAQQEHELRQLLTKEFDDLLDDDILSVTSDDSVNVSGCADPSESGRTPRRKRASGVTPASKSNSREFGYHGYSAPQTNGRPHAESHDPRFNQVGYNQPQNDPSNFRGTYNVRVPQTTQDYHVDQYATDYEQGGSNLKGQGYLQWGGSVENLDLQIGQFHASEHARMQEESVPEITYAVSHFDDAISRGGVMENQVIIGVERGETEGGNEHLKNNASNQYWSQNYAQHYRDLYRQEDIPGKDDSNEHFQGGRNTFADTHRHLGSEIQISFPNGQTLPDSYGINAESGPFSLNTDSNRLDLNYDDAYHNSLPTSVNGGMVRHTAHRHDMDVPVQGPSSPRKQDFPESYRVHYKGPQVEQQVISTNQRQEAESTNQEKNGNQIEFLQQVSDNGEEGRQLAQLQILYKARGRQLEDLTRDLETVKQEMARENRILKHQLSIAQGEKEGAVSSYKQCQGLLQETKDENAQLLGKLQAVEAHLEGLNSTKEELLKNLQTSETTIENLTHELSNLQQSDSLSRARSQHDAVVSSMQQKFDKEILDLKEKLDMANEALNQKNTEVSTLRQQLNEVIRASEHSQISRAETINRLTQSLEESQKRCQSLLESASSQEVSELKMSLKQTQASKTMSEEMCETLQSELKELKEQLSMFESASSLGVFSHTQTRTGLGDDSMTDLGIRKTLDFSTPGSQGKSDGNHSSSEVIVSLKAELERCLTSNRQKRSQVSKLQEEVRANKKEVKAFKESNSRLEKLTEEQKVKLRDFDDFVQPGQKLNAVEMRLKKDIENLTREKTAILEDNEELKKRLDELGASEERLTEINQELTSQISQMVRDYDNDKREALERCQRTCDEVHQKARDMLRQELETNFSVERAHIVTKYETEIAKVRSELQTALHEMDQVKELYVRASEERAELEDSLRTEYQQQKEREVKIARDELEKEKEEEIERLQQQIGSGKEVVQANQEDELKLRLEAELERARVEWLEQQDTQHVREEVRQAVEKEMTLKHEAAIEDLVQAKVDQAKVTWMAERKIFLESELEQRLQTEKVTWQQTANQRLEEAVNTAIDHAKEQWLTSGSGNGPNYEELLASAKVKWEEEAGRKLEEAITSAVEEAREEWEKKSVEDQATIDKRVQDQLKVEKTKWQVGADALHEVDIRQAVEEARQTWEAENGKEQQELMDPNYQHRLQTEKQKWQLEADRKLQLEVTRVTERAQRQRLSEEEKRRLVEGEVSRRVEAERDHWRQKQEEDMLCEVERQVKAAEEEWRKEGEEEKRKMKQVLEEQIGLRLKEEMNKAVEEAKLQWEKDNMSQHATFSASQSAAEVTRSILEQEVESLKQEKTRLVSELKEKETDWLQEKKALISQKDVERRQAVREVEDQCERDYNKFMAEHQDTLTQALKTSRQQQEILEHEKRELQQQYEEEILKVRGKLQAEANGNVSVNLGEADDLDGSILEQERHEWQKENQKLKKSILNRDALLQQADDHMSQEVEKLRQEMEAAYQSQLETEVHKLQQRYESEFNESLPTSEHEMGKIQVEIQKMAENFEKEKAMYVGKIEHLEGQLAEKTQCLINLEQEIKDGYKKELDRLLGEKQSLIENLNAKQSQLDEKMKENDTLRVSVKNMESAYRRDMKSQKEKFDEINTRLQKSERSLQEARKRNSLEVEALKKAVSESEAALTNLTQKMMEKQKANAMLMEAQKKQHKTEKRELVKQLKKYSDRSMTSTPVQTEESGDIMLDLRSQYLDTVDKIREDVMQHITQTNLRAADTVRTGITREKQVTVTQLKSFYRSSIRKILQGELIGADLEGKLSSIDQALEAMSISISSSRSATPDEEVKVNATSQGKDQSSSSSISLDGSRSSASNLTPRSESSVTSSASSSNNYQVVLENLQITTSVPNGNSASRSERNSGTGSGMNSGKQSSKMITKNGKDVFPRPSQNLSLFDRNGSRILESPSPVDSEPENIPFPSERENNDSRSFRPVDPPKRLNNVTVRSNCERVNAKDKRNKNGGVSVSSETYDKDGFLRPKDPSKKRTADKQQLGTSEFNQQTGSQPQQIKDSSLPPTSSRQRPQLSLLRRSMEDEFSTPKQLEPFSYQGMTKAQSEIALNKLADFENRQEGRFQGASPGNVQISYKYTPLRQSLQTASPSTSLFSNHSLSEGDLRITEADSRNDEPVLNFQSLGLGKPSPRKFNPVPERLDSESGYHTPKKSPVGLFGKKMTHSLDNLSVLGLSLEEQSLEEEFMPLASVKPGHDTNGGFRDFQRVGNFPGQLSKGRQPRETDSNISSSSRERGQKSAEQSNVARTNGIHSYRELHKGRQLQTRDNDSGRESFRSPLVTISSRSSLPNSLRSEK